MTGPPQPHPCARRSRRAPATPTRIDAIWPITETPSSSPHHSAASNEPPPTRLKDRDYDPHQPQEHPPARLDGGLRGARHQRLQRPDTRRRARGRRRRALAGDRTNLGEDRTRGGGAEAAAAGPWPVIVKPAVKTVRSIGSDALWSMWASMTRGIEVPVALHLDHCPDRSVITECLRRGWNSVLFDASALPVEENLRQTIEVVAEARSHGAEVEGEIESITGVEDGIGSDAVAETQPLAVAIDFIERTGIDVFAPAIGNAHGRYRSAPTLDAERVRQIHDATGIPQALHGGSGLSPQQFTELIQAGCAKVNISTALKETYMRASFEHLQRAAASDKWDPPALFTDTKAAVIWMTIQHIRLFGSEGR